MYIFRLCNCTACPGCYCEYFNFHESGLFWVLHRICNRNDVGWDRTIYIYLVTLRRKRCHSYGIVRGHIYL